MRLSTFFIGAISFCCFLIGQGQAVFASQQMVAATPIAQWSFQNEDIHRNGNQLQVTDHTGTYVGSCQDGAMIKTIGNSQQHYNVLFFGNNNNSYFDMGTAIGEAVYGLNDYTVSIYYHRESNASNAYGQWLYTFSNGENMNADPVGCLFFEPLRGFHAICSTNYNNETGVQMGSIPNGSWHHICYIQNGTQGALYLDGVSVGSGTVTSTPANTLKKNGRSGTTHNYLGRPCYAGDAYLQNAYLYDFKLYNKALSESELTSENIATTLTRLNDALAKNNDYASTLLKEEADHLDLGSLNAIESNLSLPTQGSLHSDIKIEWESSHPQLISTNGVLNRPQYVDFDVSLTAILTYGGDRFEKVFHATVKSTEKMEFDDNLMLHYDFSLSEGNLVKDLSSNQWNGRLVNDAHIVELPLLDDTLHVLQLGQDSAYFDMGNQVGLFIPTLNNYTIGCYYFIDTAYDELGWNGNALWNFSNSSDVDLYQDAYMACFLNNQGYYISPSSWSEEQSIRTGQPADKGKWHHIAYTQQGDTGVLYLDGLTAGTEEIELLPSRCMLQPKVIQTSCHWIGRSCYAGDTYLQHSMVYDFRMYNKSLSQYEIEHSVWNVVDRLKTLNKIPLSELNRASASQPGVYKKGSTCCLYSLQAGDKILLYSIHGQTLFQSIAVENRLNIDLSTYNPGFYLLHIVRQKEHFVRKIRL